MVVNAQLVAAYRKARAEGARPHAALSALRTAPVDTLDFYDDTARLTRDGFDIVVKVQPDQYTDVRDFEYLGTFSDVWVPGAIKRPNAGYREHEYIVPAQTVAQIRRDLSRFGYSRSTAENMAREYIAKDVARLEGLANGDWSPVIVFVRAMRYGRELGVASMSGIESDAGDYINEIAAELIGEAIEDAGTFAARLASDPDELVGHDGADFDAEAS